MNEQSTTDPAALRRELGYITPSELYAMLGISPITGRNRQSAGSLPPHYKVGKNCFYKIAEVDAWIRRRRVSKAAA